MIDAVETEIDARTGQQVFEQLEDRLQDGSLVGVGTDDQRVGESIE